jgi:hypothetical protein
VTLFEDLIGLRFPNMIYFNGLFLLAKLKLVRLIHGIGHLKRVGYPKALVNIWFDTFLIFIVFKLLLLIFFMHIPSRFLVDML